jgi:hypothetical protein
LASKKAEFFAPLEEGAELGGWIFSGGKYFKTKNFLSGEKL